MQIAEDGRHIGPGIDLSVVAFDQTGDEWAFDVSGAFTSKSCLTEAHGHVALDV